MKNLILYSSLFILFISQTSLANSPAEESYQSYNDIVSGLQSELRTKQKTKTQKLLLSSYSLAAGLTSHIHKINKKSKNILGFGLELGVYNFLMLPVKFKLEYASGSSLKNLLFKAKTDYSIYRYNLMDLKVGLAAGLGTYRLSSSDFTSLFLTPSIAGFYQINKSLDVNLNLAYSFHAKDEVSSHLSPSVNLVTYF